MTNIDARTTSTLFKAHPFWNGFGFFATYEHANLLNEAILGSMRLQAMEVRKIHEFEQNLNDAIEFITELQKEDVLDKEIGEDIDSIDISSDRQTFTVVDLNSRGVLDLLLDTKEMPEREMKVVLHKILALKQMSDSITEAINEGINKFDEENELAAVRKILHEDFQLDTVDARLEEVRKEPLTDNALQTVMNQSLSLANDLNNQVYQPVFSMIFKAVLDEKKKRGVE